MGPVITRRSFLAHVAGASALLAGGPALDAHVAGARALAGEPTLDVGTVPAQSPLSSVETRTLVAWCDLLVPGAGDGDVGDFVNTQLAKSPDDALLSIRYFDWPPPWNAFYQQGLNALNAASGAAFGSPFVKLTSDQRDVLLQRLLDGSQGWSGPPFFLFYLVTRSDAVDVLYGVPSGYARIGLPYIPQVAPRRPW